MDVILAKVARLTAVTAGPGLPLVLMGNADAETAATGCVGKVRKQRTKPQRARSKSA
jgi:hypothetical protein